MVKQATERFLKWHKSLEIVPLICKNKEFVFKTCWHEYEKLNKKINGIDDAERAKIHQAMERTGIKISNKYLLQLKFLAERDELNPQVLSIFQEVDK
jgi:glutamyl-tRNA reductase